MGWFAMVAQALQRWLRHPVWNRMVPIWAGPGDDPRWCAGGAARVQSGLDDRYRLTPSVRATGATGSGRRAHA